MANYLLAALVPLLWGSTYAAVSLFLHDMSPFWVAVWRALPAGLLLLLLKPGKPPLPWFRMSLLSVFNIGAFFPLLFIAAYRLPGSVAGTLGATLPLMLMFIQWLIEGKKPEWKMLLLAIVGFSGIVLILNPSADIDPIGAGAALTATALVARSSLWLKDWPVTDIFRLTAWQLTLGGVLLVPLALLVEGAPKAITIAELPGLIWISLLNSSFAYWAFSRSIKKIGADSMAMISMLNPLAAVALGIFLVGEILGPLQWMGIALVVTSLLLMVHSKQKTQKPCEPARTYSPKAIQKSVRTSKFRDRY
ncbi:DMT family transporter [Grimontia hollisae]|uniref:Putative DMT superfamily transporter inner membrane protein n=1 Tax=Grimontia hollisae TaxID=673 RepID=A0A377J8P8_GRIHO|nr:DMT family transporter [Grimontia hollisae]STO98625.1 putative DMT superfamily transporter inner membrane protein [Grimontia hollisae]